MAKAQLGAGNVSIELDGEAVVLRPTLKAAQTISRQAGGIRAAIQSVGEMNLDAVTNIIGLGLGYEGKDIKTLPDKVYTTGLTELVVPVTRFLLILANGGRPADEDEGGSGEDNPQT